MGNFFSNPFINNLSPAVHNFELHRWYRGILRKGYQKSLVFCGSIARMAIMNFNVHILRITFFRQTRVTNCDTHRIPQGTTKNVKSKTNDT
jgi:hypothetical protein